MYTGHVGSGKTYEVVKEVILPALAKGRTVVANIEGLNPDKVLDFCEKQGSVDPGELLVVEREDIRRPDFFPSRQSDGSYRPSSFVPLGALVVVDECPVYWGADKAILPQHLAFFREHRHICSADGTACDLVVISQTVDAVHRSLRGLVEFSVDCRRMSALGLNKKYSTVTYQGARRSGKYVMGRAARAYDAKVFPLYSSFAHSAGRILQTDRRFTIWGNWQFWALFACAVVAFSWSGWHLYSAFARAAPVPSSRSPSLKVASPGAPFSVHRVASSVVRPVGPAPAPAVLAETGPTPARNIGGESITPVSKWRIVGSVRFSGRWWAVLRRGGYPLRYLPIDMCRVTFGAPVSCDVAGELFEPDGSDTSSGGASTWAPDLLAAKAAANPKGVK
jgi:zona occludens toxin